MADSRFTSQGSHAEELLKTQTVGLVNLSDFRKRRAEAIEQSERERDQQDGVASGTPSGAVTPSERSTTPQPQQVKKRRKAGKGKLSFAIEGDEEENEDRGGGGSSKSTARKADAMVAASTTLEGSAPQPSKGAGGRDEIANGDVERPVQLKRRLGPNISIAAAPKVMTKSVLQREAAEREKLRKEFIIMQEQVKATEISIPFVFHEGADLPGGICRVKKGDPVWLFLDKCRKLGAEKGAMGGGDAKSRREWARVGVDDLLLVRGEIIIPHHYEFYYFIVNKTVGYDSKPLFNYSTKPPETTEDDQRNVSKGPYNPLSRPGEKSNQESDRELEGATEDPGLTKVVNRQWYARNKHIFPASMWEEFDPNKDYTQATRRDTLGNAYFFSR